MREEIRDAFKVFDRNNDGRLSSQELRDILVTMGDKMTEEDINDLMRTADINGDGMIDYEGLLIAFINTLIFFNDAVVNLLLCITEKFHSYWAGRSSDICRPILYLAMTVNEAYYMIMEN